MTIDNTLYRGRPTDRRIPKETRCYDFLDGLGVEYFRVDHERADTIPDCEQVEQLLGCRICKNLFLTNRQQTDFYLLIMPGEKPFKTKLLSKQIGSARLSFAGPEHMERLLDITPGSVSVLGLMNDKDKAVRLLVDRDLLQEESFGSALPDRGPFQYHPARSGPRADLRGAALADRGMSRNSGRGRLKSRRLLPLSAGSPCAAARGRLPGAWRWTVWKARGLTAPVMDGRTMPASGNTAR